MVCLGAGSRLLLEAGAGERIGLADEEWAPTVPLLPPDHGRGALMHMTADRISALPTDEGNDTDAIRDELASGKIAAVIPAKRNRRTLQHMAGPSIFGAIRPAVC